MVGLALTPILIFKLCPPEIQETPEAPKEAADRLKEMGPMSRDEMIMMGTMLFAVTLWVRLIVHHSPHKLVQAQMWLN